MPVNEIIQDVASRGRGSLYSEGNAPVDDGAPDGEPAPTTGHDAGPLPPYLHIQTLNDRGGLVLIGTILSFVGLARRMM